MSTKQARGAVQWESEIWTRPGFECSKGLDFRLDPEDRPFETDQTTSNCHLKSRLFSPGLMDETIFDTVYLVFLVILI